jgi:hypothetical protein
MEILIINIQLDWVFRLYEEYILSIKYFIKKYYKNINVQIKYFDVNIFNENKYNLIDFAKYNKILYTGDLIFFKKLKNILNNNSYKLYFINIEQLSHESYYTMFRTIDTDINIIDYSEENIVYIKNSYNNYFLIPPYYEYYNIDITDKTIDILSICNNSYREILIKNINIDQNFNIILLNECYGNIRNDYFNKTKIYINIHGSEKHLTMELIRIVNLIFRKVIVISQNSVYHDILFLKKYILVHNDLNSLNICATEILNNYEYYYHLIYDNFDENEYYNYIMENMDFFLNQPNISEN